MPNRVVSLWSTKPWSTVSNAADRSSSNKTTTQPRSTARKMLIHEIYVFELRIDMIQVFSARSSRFFSTNNIHEKISPFWLVKSSAVFFKQCRKELIQCKKRKQTKHSDWSMIRETHRRPIKSFVFKSSARPGWRNFSLIAWYACVPSAQPSRNFFIYIINK